MGFTVFELTNHIAQYPLLAGGGRDQYPPFWGGRDRSRLTYITAICVFHSLVSNGITDSKSSIKRCSSSKRPRQPAIATTAERDEDTSVSLVANAGGGGGGGGGGKEGGSGGAKAKEGVSVGVVCGGGGVGGGGGGSANGGNGKPPKKKVKTVKRR